MAANTASVIRVVREKQRIIDDWKAARGCEECSESDPVVLDAHHRNPEDKHPRLKKGRVMLSQLSWNDLSLELDKCDVLCANCHRREWAKGRAMYAEERH